MLSDADRDLAAELVTTAGRLALRMRGEGLTGERKTSVSDIVTAADRAAEAYVLQELRARRPDDGVLGEEGTAVPSKSGRTWVIDPVDGTYNFFTGSSYWCSALALRDDADADPHDPAALLGAVYHVEEDRLWLGGPDVGTTMNGTPIWLPGQTDLGLLSAASYLHPRNFTRAHTFARWQRVVTPAATYRALGSGSVDLGRVAIGQLGYWVHLSCPQWDWLPGKALVRGAGGDTRTLAIEDDHWFIAGPNGVANQLAALLQQ